MITFVYYVHLFFLRWCEFLKWREGVGPFSTEQSHELQMTYGEAGGSPGATGFTRALPDCSRRTEACRSPRLG
jgi:hypothetical protein